MRESGALRKVIPHTRANCQTLFVHLLVHSPSFSVLNFLILHYGCGKSDLSIYSTCFMEEREREWVSQEDGTEVREERGIEMHGRKAAGGRE